jgi:hypothetical protein
MRRFAASDQQYALAIPATASTIVQIKINPPITRYFQNQENRYVRKYIYSPDVSFHENKSQHYQYYRKQDYSPANTVNPLPKSIAQIQVFFDKSEISNNPCHIGLKHVKSQIILLEKPDMAQIETIANQHGKI